MLVVALFHIVFMNYTKGISNNCQSVGILCPIKMVDNNLR